MVVPFNTHKILGTCNKLIKILFYVLERQTVKLYHGLAVRACKRSIIVTVKKIYPSSDPPTLGCITYEHMKKKNTHDYYSKIVTKIIFPRRIIIRENLSQQKSY